MGDMFRGLAFIGVVWVSAVLLVIGGCGYVVGHAVASAKAEP